MAFASGFGSLRRFNRAMREVFRATPKELRSRRRRTDRLTADGGLVLRLPFTQPYDWQAVAAFLAARAIPGVKSVVDGVCRRTIALDGEPGMLELGPGGADHLLLRAHLPYWEGVIHVVERAARLSGVDFDPVAARAQLSRDPVLGPLVSARPGVRVPGMWAPFEVAVRAALGAAGEEPRGLDADAAHHFALRAGERDAFLAGDPAVRQAVHDRDPGPVVPVVLPGDGPPDAQDLTSTGQEQPRA